MSVTTITINVKTKQMLEKLKGRKSWDKFLRELAMEYERIRRIKYAEKYLEERPMSDEEAQKILEFVEESRESWRLEES